MPLNAPDIPVTEYVIGPVPPVVAPIVNDPFDAPHVALVGVNARAVGPALLLIVVFDVKVHPFASFTITVYVPAARPVKLVVALKPAGPGDTEYVYAETPPVTAPIVNEPLAVPQLELVGVSVTAVGPPLLLIVVLVVNVQPFASFTITV